MRARSLRPAALAAAALCVVIALALVLFARRDAAQPVTYAGTPLVPPKAASDAVLIDGAGRPAHVLDPNVPVTFLFFGYTHCPDECPLALATLAKAYRELSPAQAARMRVVFVTVDPLRDTPAVVGRYVAKFDAHFIGLSGSPAALATVWNAYGVSVDLDTRDISHGDAIYAIDATKHVVLIYPPEFPASGLASDAAKLTS